MNDRESKHWRRLHVLLGIALLATWAAGSLPWHDWLLAGGGAVAWALRTLSIANESSPLTLVLLPTLYAWLESRAERNQPRNPGDKP